MHIKNYKKRCEKRSLPKAKGVCKTYGELMFRAADWLSANSTMKGAQNGHRIHKERRLFHSQYRPSPK